SLLPFAKARHISPHQTYASMPVGEYGSTEPFLMHRTTCVFTTLARYHMQYKSAHAHPIADMPMDWVRVFFRHHPKYVRPAISCEAKLMGFGWESRHPRFDRVRIVEQVMPRSV